MFWDTYIEQERDGHWVAVDIHSNNQPTYRLGPCATHDEAKVAEIQDRIELHRRYGSPTTER